MTILELAERDLRKAHRAHMLACERSNIPTAELVHTLELVKLRKEILEIIRRNCNE